MHWAVRGSPVFWTLYRPPTKCKVHTCIIKCWLYCKHKKWLSWTLSKQGGNPVNWSDSRLCFLGLENHGEKSEKWVGVRMMKSLIRKLQQEPQGRLKEARRTSPAQEEAYGSIVTHRQALHNTKVCSDGWPVTPSPPSYPNTWNRLLKPVDDEFL